MDYAAPSAMCHNHVDVRGRHPVIIIVLLILQVGGSGNNTATCMIVVNATSSSVPTCKYSNAL